MKLATHLNSTILQGAGAALIIAAFFQPRHSPLEELLDSLGLALIYLGFAVRAYIWGRDEGRREALRVEITRVWSAQQPFDQYAPDPFVAKTFREGASK